MRLSRSAMLLTLAGSAPSLAGQPAIRPPADLPISAAFHEASGVLVVIGGYSPTAASAETWLWNGTAWRRHDGPGPSSRDEPLLAYDRTRGRIVLHGGERGAEPALTDTWEWDGAQWTKVAEIGPPPRSGANMAYDEGRKRMVVFGGGSPGSSPALDDTWEWDGRRWAEAPRPAGAAGPSARFLHGMAYDPRRGRVVLFGGARFVDGQPKVNDDTWEWNGTAWHRLGGASPGPRDHVTMAFVPDLGAIVMHGGGNPGIGLMGDTWRLDDHGWTRIATDGPARGRHRLVYDSRRGRLLMYGGWSPKTDSVPARRNNDLWEYRAGWKAVTP